MNKTVQALTLPRAYDHRVESVELIETHLSWVFLTGKFAYKLKKPLKLSFVDFSTLDKRAHFCREEVRLNQRFTQGLYLGVHPVILRADGSAFVSENPVPENVTIVDWLVKMLQFDQSEQADHLLAAGGLASADFRLFGARLAHQHGSLPAVLEPPNLEDAAHENYVTLKATLGSTGQTSGNISTLQAQVDRLSDICAKQLLTQQTLLKRRVHSGYVRECHGDLHLANLVYRDNALQAFDCLEFNQSLREVDVWNDLAFLVMDLCIRAREDLAYSFVDGYLDACGDYDGAVLLGLFTQYRSVIRAKVAAIAYSQSDCEDTAAYRRVQAHLNWAEHKAACKPGLLLVCCGLSGSGKSYWAAQLVAELCAIRIRSDVYRKTLAGLGAHEQSGSGLGTGLYNGLQSDQLYANITQLCSQLLPLGENIIVDATCLKKSHREDLLQAANKAGSQSLVLHLTAPAEVLRERIMQRKRQAEDASEADLSVLAMQQEMQEEPDATEPVVVVGPETTEVGQLVQLISQRLFK